MKILKLTLSVLFTSILLTACSSKVQTRVVESNKEDVSELLNQTLEDCKEIKDPK